MFEWYSCGKNVQKKKKIIAKKRSNGILRKIRIRKESSQNKENKENKEKKKEKRKPTTSNGQKKKNERTKGKVE